MRKAGYKLVLLTNENESKNKINKLIKEKNGLVMLFILIILRREKEEVFVGKNESLYKTKFKYLQKVNIKKE